MRSVISAVASVLLLVGCGPRAAVVLGQAPSGQARSVASLKGAKPAAPVVLNGVMIEKCPVAGCWFRLQDETGIIKVDTKSAGFVVAEVPVKSRMVVSGRIVADGDTLSIEATGLRY